MYMHFIWFTPVQLMIITFFLYQELGPTSLIATVVVILQVPLQIGLANLYSALRYVINYSSSLADINNLTFHCRSTIFTIISIKERIIRARGAENSMYIDLVMLSRGMTTVCTRSNRDRVAGYNHFVNRRTTTKRQIIMSATVCSRLLLH